MGPDPLTQKMWIHCRSGFETIVEPHSSSVVPLVPVGEAAQGDHGAGAAASHCGPAPSAPPTRLLLLGFCHIGGARLKHLHVPTIKEKNGEY